MDIIFKKIHESLRVFKGLNLTADEIVNICAHEDGIDNIMDIQKNFFAILALNININLIKQANSAFPFLVFKSIGFHANQILNVLNSHGQTPMKSTKGHSVP